MTTMGVCANRRDRLRIFIDAQSPHALAPAGPASRSSLDDPRYAELAESNAAGRENILERFVCSRCLSISHARRRPRGSADAPGHESVDFIVTSPPYWNILQQRVTHKAQQ